MHPFAVDQFVITEQITTAGLGFTLDSIDNTSTWAGLVDKRLFLKRTIVNYRDKMIAEINTNLPEFNNLLQKLNLTTK